MVETRALSQIKWSPPLPMRPLVDGYTETSPNNTIRSEMDSGPSRIRKTSSAGLSKRSCVYIFSATAKAAFDSFFLDAEGRSFWWPDPGDNYTYKYARINGSATFTPEGSSNYWRGKIEFEIWPYLTNGRWTG